MHDMLNYSVKRESICTGFWVILIHKTKENAMNNDFDLKAIGLRMKTVRTRLHKTQADMAQVLEISLSHYSKLEVGIGGISHGLIHKFCTAFNVDQPWFVYGQGSAPDSIVVANKNTANLDPNTICRIVELVLNKDIQKMAENFSQQFKVDFPHSMAMMVSELLKFQDEQTQVESKNVHSKVQEASKELLNKGKSNSSRQS